MADPVVGRRENSDDTATFNASVRSDLRGSASPEAVMDSCESVLIGGPKVYHPEAYLHARPWPAVAREARSGKRYRRLARRRQPHAKRLRIMRLENKARRAIIREWISLPREKRAAGEQSRCLCSESN